MRFDLSTACRTVLTGRDPARSCALIREETIIVESATVESATVEHSALAGGACRAARAAASGVTA